MSLCGFRCVLTNSASILMRKEMRDPDLRQAIRVKVPDGTVMLQGCVDSLADRQSGECAALAAPGVHKVGDRLRVP